MNSYLSRVRDWLKARLALVGPAACFLAGCALSYALTVRQQWQQGYLGPEGYLAAYYYQGKFDAPAIFEFSINGIWSLLTYHLPAVVAIAALVALALLLAATLFSKIPGRFPENAIAVLGASCLAISVGAALLGRYPLGDIRQVIYLGPLVFLAVGVAFQGAAGGLAGLTRRSWLAPALAAAVAVAIALAGVGAITQDRPYQTMENSESVFTALKENVRDDDLVYAVWGVVPALRFYQGDAEKPANYYYGTVWCAPTTEPCFREMVDLAGALPNAPDRIFLVHDDKAILEKVERLGAQVSVESVVTDGYFHIVLITNVKESF